MTQIMAIILSENIQLPDQSPHVLNYRADTDTAYLESLPLKSMCFIATTANAATTRIKSHLSCERTISPQHISMRTDKLPAINTDTNEIQTKGTKDHWFLLSTGSPTNVKDLVSAAASWLNEMVLSGKFKPWNAFFSGSGKGLDVSKC